MTQQGSERNQLKKSLIPKRIWNSEKNLVMVVGNPRCDEESTKIPNNTWKIAKEPNKPSQERTRSKLQVKMDIAMESHFLQRKKNKEKKNRKKKKVNLRQPFRVVLPINRSVLLCVWRWYYLNATHTVISALPTGLWRYYNFIFMLKLYNRMIVLQCYLGMAALKRNVDVTQVYHTILL